MLTIGSRLGPYEIVEPIGAGGMGEVYRARDTRLDRSVAIKILPSEFAQNPQFKVRFEREAKTISQLNHPHICTLHDVGHEDGLDYLVMEYLEGENLADRIQKGPLPIREVLRYGAEIADALGRAHRQQVVHRDLKPGNIMLTKSGVKLLDFGLAKGVGVDMTLEPARAPSTLQATDLSVAQSPSRAATQYKPLTQEGTLLGTFQYMAPEQLSGEEADARSDIFALGAVLYEMVTGHRAFDGKNKTSVITNILSADPRPMSELQPLTPPALEHVIGKCLAKDPDDRWQSAHDVAEELRWIAEGGSKAGVAAPVAKRRAARERLAWSVAAVVALIAMALAIGFFLRAPKTGPLVHFSIETPENASLFPFDERGIALSPDGSRLAFVAASGDGRRLVYLRPLSSNSAQPLAGTEDASYPFWSPDGRYIGFFAGGKLKKIDSGSGPSQVICDAPSGRGGTWNEQGTIVFEPTISSALYRVPAAGGAPVQVTSLTGGDGARHRWPVFLPDGEHFLFVGESNLYVGSLKSRETKKLIDDASNGAFVPPDRLVFSRGAILMTQKIDVRNLAMQGDPIPLPFGSVSHWVPKRLSIFSVARNGTLAFLPATSAVSRIVWIDRNGHEVGSVGEPGLYLDVALSADGTKIAVVKGAINDSDIWLVDLADGRWSRFTFNPGGYANVTWSGDASLLAFAYVPGGVGQVYVKALSRSSEPTAVAHTNEWNHPFSFAPDGRVLLITRQLASTGFDIFSVTMDGKATMQPVVQTPFAESRPRFSPDGKWFAYDSNESGRTEVFVRRFPPTADQWQVSANGGVSPLWRPDGRELYYIGSQSLMVVPIGGGAKLDPGTPRPLFRLPNQLLASSLSSAGPVGSLISGVTRDGGKFLLRSSAEERTASLNVVLNWQSVLREQEK